MSDKPTHYTTDTSTKFSTQAPRFTRSGNLPATPGMVVRMGPVVAERQRRYRSTLRRIYLALGKMTPTCADGCEECRDEIDKAMEMARRGLNYEPGYKYHPKRGKRKKTRCV